MIYQESSVKRTFNICFSHGEDVISSLKEFCREKNLESAIFFLIGALRNANIVTGPKTCSTPPEPVKQYFNDCREIVAIGTVAGGEIHLHASVGREKDAWTGCIRERATAYLVVEGVVLELTGHAWREMDRDLGVKTPHYEDLAISP